LLLQDLPHELDRNYAALKNELRLLDKKSDEFKILDKYMKTTSAGWFKGSILEVWCLDREGEKDRMDKFSHLTNRKLLWHGTNVAVVAAILRSGLRIMPHSGGRVGRGIYHGEIWEDIFFCFFFFKQKHSGVVLNLVFFFFCPNDTASEQSKSAGYTQCANNIGIMFLDEVALGNMKEILRDDSSLTKAPAGYDSVL
jgi:poly [ADP-ribose] polymerase